MFTACFLCYYTIKTKKPIIENRVSSVAAPDLNAAAGIIVRSLRGEASSVTGKTKREWVLTGLFTAFVFLQFAVLGIANHAGEEYLPSERREMVYYALQVFVILGFLIYGVFERRIKEPNLRRSVTAFVLIIFCAGTVVMLAAPRSSLFYVMITMAVMPCLGCIGGAVNHRMSRETSAGAKTAWIMGVGSSIAVALQYLLQLQWGITPLLPVFMLAAFIFLGYHLLFNAPEPEEKTGDTTPATLRRLVFSCVIAAVFLLFVSFYNTYIHHLQVLTGYTEYNVYSWPRLMMIPGYLLFAVIGDRKQGRPVPIAALCIALAALLNSVLTVSDGTYWLNMCLFYVALSASVAYYDLVFWRLAQNTKHPSLWASMGRIMDSGIVLLAGTMRISLLSAPVVLGLNIAGLTVILLLMALGGDFNFSDPPAEVSEPLRLLSSEDTFERMRGLYGLTPRETEVLRELVLTEDKQTVISERLSIQLKTLQDYVTRLYRKTGVTTRSGLTELYHECMLD